MQISLKTRWWDEVGLVSVYNLAVIYGLSSYVRVGSGVKKRKWRLTFLECGNRNLVEEWRTASQYWRPPGRPWLLISCETIEKSYFLQWVETRAGAFLGEYSKVRQEKDHLWESDYSDGHGTKAFNVRKKVNYKKDAVQWKRESRGRVPGGVRNCGCRSYWNK